MQATTHIDFQLRAQKAGLSVRVIHGISVTTLVPGSTGLSDYKFGRSTTLTYPYGDWIVTSPLEVMLRNQKQGLHTLVLFDLDPTGAGTGEQRPMQPKDAFASIEAMAKKISESDVDEAVKEQANGLFDSMCVLCSDLGTDDASMKTTLIKQSWDANRREVELHGLLSQHVGDGARSCQPLEVIRWILEFFFRSCCFSGSSLESG